MRPLYACLWIASFAPFFPTKEMFYAFTIQFVAAMLWKLQNATSTSANKNKNKRNDAYDEGKLSKAMIFTSLSLHNVKENISSGCFGAIVSFLVCFSHFMFACNRDKELAASFWNAVFMCVCVCVCASHSLCVCASVLPIDVKQSVKFSATNTDLCDQSITHEQIEQTKSVQNMVVKLTLTYRNSFKVMKRIRHSVLTKSTSAIYPCIKPLVFFQPLRTERFLN